MRSMWTGQLGFGLVQFGVGLYKATEDHDQSFNQFHGPTCFGRIGYVKTCKECGEVLEPSDIMRGTELDDGRVVVVTEDDLATLESEQAKLIEIIQFVDAAEIDPIQFEAAYFVAARAVGRGRTKVDVPSKAYALLANAMVGSGLVALARFPMRNKTKLAILRVVDGVILLHTLKWPDEVRRPDELPGMGGDFSAAEMKAATMVVESMVGKYDPDGLVDLQQMRLRELIEAKADDAVFVSEPAQDLDAAEDVSDLLAQLEASIKAHPAGKKAPAKRRRKGAA